MRKILLFALLCGSLFTAKLYAQFPGCPTVNIAQGTNGVLVLPCGQTCTNLTATAFAGSQTTAYTVGAIPYTPPFSFNTGTQILVNTDDIWSGVITLPFNFCFFGNTYNRIIVGSNGVCSFNVTNAAAGNSWQIGGTVPSANPTDLTNSIMCPWQDIDPTFQGQIFYEIGGTYPCRYFKVSWFNVPYFGDPNSVNTDHCQNIARRATQQVILYETSNVIDMYIQRKDVCSDWNNGRATQGIQNANGTVAYVVPGRNGSVWTATNDAQRFTPSGAANYSIAWYNGATQIGTGNTVNVCPVGGTNYRAEATYTVCAGTQIVVNSYLYVNTSGVNANIDSVREVDCFNGTTGAAYASFNTNSAVLSYGWTPGGAPNSTSITGIPAGTYIFTVTDSSNCVSSDTVTLTNPAPFTVTVPDSSITSCSGGTTSLTATPNGGVAGYTYLWTPGNSTNQTITGIGSGTYTVTVTDSRQCTASDAGTVTITGSNPTFNPPVITDATCAGNDGSIVVSVTGASGAVTYTWSPVQPDNDTITGLAGGSYSVTATDANGCTASATYNVGTGAPITFGAPVITDATCAGNDGSIVVTVIGATDPVSYAWSPVQPDNDTITGLAGGSYSVTATDANGCTVSATYNVGTGAPITFGAPVITDATCAGNDGSIVVTVIGATDPISYAWSPVQPDNDTITGLAAGSYSVTATDANGCTVSATYNVGAGAPITFGAPVITDASCTGLTGSIVVTVIGATDPISYAWSPVQPDNDTITGLGAGSYSVTATDANGCTASATYNVGAGTGISFGPAILQDASCNANDGGIVVTVNNATAPIDFVWSGGLPNNDTVGGLGAGIYNVTATDANGCSASASYTIVKQPAFTFNPPVITDASCGASNGSIVVSVSGATPPLDYAWTNSLPNNDTVTGLAAGSYTVTVTDANGCSDFATYTVGQNNAFTLGAPVITNAGCTTNDGSIVVNTTGAAQPVTFVWSPAQANNDTITGLATGSYSVTATDNNGCTASATYNVGQNNPIIITNATVNDVSCSGTGSISVTATGGTGTLTYAWGPSGSGNPLTGLAAGTYTLTITDQGGCSTTATYIVGNTPCGDCPAVSTDNNVTIACGETCTDLVATAIAGYKTTAYSGAPIAYNPIGSFTTGTPILANIDDTWSSVITLPFNFCFFGNTYNQLVVGSNGIVNFDITQAGGFNEWAITNTIPSVLSPNDARNAIMGPWHDMDPTFQGSIYYSVIDTYPCRKFVVSWSDIPLYGDANSLDDACDNPVTQTQQIVLYETTNVIDIYIQDKTTCVASVGDGLATEGIQNAAGTIAYTVPGRNASVWTATNDAYRFTPAGAPNYVINWFEGAALVGTGDTITVCPDSSTIYRVEAVYTNCDNSTITVSDSVFVTVEGNVTVNIDSFTNVSCNGGNDGAVYASYTSTDSTIVSFGWTPNGAGQTSLTGLSAGTYVFSATNAAGCTVTDTVVLSEPAPLVANVPDTTVYNCVAGPISVSLTATATGGTPAYGFEWAGGEITATIAVTAAGTYTVTVTDANGCTASDAGTVTLVIADPIFNTPVITNVTCNGADNGSIVVSVSQATPPITYNWSNSLPANDTVTDLDPGTYTVTATDANGCSVSASYDITEPAAIVIGNPTITDAGCAVGGTITVTATGGTGTLTYGWSNGDTGTFADSLAAGNHTLTVTDASGCTATATYTVNAAPGAVAFGTPVIVNVGCNGGNNGSIHVVVTSGTSPFTYVWSPNVSTDSTADGLAAGTYNVTVTDGQGCSASATYSVTQPSVITLGPAVITPATCLVGGTVTVIATGGTGTLTYGWSNGDTGVLADSLAGGTVTLTVTDANGCSVTGSYVVPSNSITLGNTVVTNVTCNGSTNGSIHLVVTGFTAPLVYVWSPNVSIDSTADGLAAGVYNVTVTDGAGCTVSATYTITEPTAVTLGNATITDATCSQGGSIVVTATGGTGTLTYTWSPAQPNSGTITGLTAGTYLLTVTDANGCSVTASYTVGGTTSVLTFNNAIINNVSCFGGANGSITASANGGGGTITYVWNTSPVQQTGATATGLIAGTYTVTATEQNGCSASASYTVNEPTQLTVAINATSLLCFGSEEGVATANASGGTGSYTYEWNDNQTTQTIDSLPVGIVLVTVTDANGCTAATSTIIGQSPAISYNSQVNQPTCADLGFGTEILTPRGGTGAITITIPSENITVTLSMVGADTVYTATFATGTYNFTLCDALGCCISGFFFVEAGAANQSFDIIADSTSCYGDNFNNGGITVTPTTMANGPYTYSLDGGSFQNDSIFTGVGAGNHTVVVSNKYGCLDTLDALVEQPAQLFVNASPDTIITAAEVGNQITVNAENFINPVYVWTPATGLSCDSCNNPLATVSANTVYYLVVSEDGVEGCAASDSVVVIINGKLKMPNAFTPNNDGKNDLYGPFDGTSIGLTVTEFRIINRWGQTVHNTPEDWDGKFKGEDQPAGTYIYYITVRTPDDANPGTDKTIQEQGAFTLLR